MNKEDEFQKGVYCRSNGENVSFIDKENVPTKGLPLRFVV